MRKTRLDTPSVRRAGYEAESNRAGRWRGRVETVVSVFWLLCGAHLFVVTFLCALMQASHSLGARDEVTVDPLPNPVPLVLITYLLALLITRFVFDRDRMIDVLKLAAVALVLDAFSAGPLIEWINRWHGAPAVETTIYAYEFTGRNTFRGGVYACHFIAFRHWHHSREIVVYPFPHPARRKEGQACIEVRKGLFGAEWIDSVRTCRDKNSNPTAATSLQTRPCNPSSKWKSYASLPGPEVTSPID